MTGCAIIDQVRICEKIVLPLVRCVGRYSKQLLQQQGREGVGGAWAVGAAWRGNIMGWWAIRGFVVGQESLHGQAGGL